MGLIWAVSLVCVERYVMEMLSNEDRRDLTAEQMEIKRTSD